MKYTPLPMTSDMVRATLHPQTPKGQTRRIAHVSQCEHEHDMWHWSRGRASLTGPMAAMLLSCPYGQPGDRLWVRERCRVTDTALHQVGLASASSVRGQVTIRYDADDSVRTFEWPTQCKGRPVKDRCLPYGGPRAASRITLELTAVRVERLQAITAGDAISEGVLTLGDDWLSRHFPSYAGDMLEWIEAGRVGRPPLGPGPLERFRALWESIHGKGSWDLNPWVWALSFRRIEP